MDIVAREPSLGESHIALLDCFKDRRDAQTDEDCFGEERLITAKLDKIVEIQLQVF